MRAVFSDVHTCMYGYTYMSVTLRNVTGQTRQFVVTLRNVTHCTGSADHRYHARIMMIEADDTQSWGRGGLFSAWGDPMQP